MAEGLGRERWAHTSVICSLIANANRDPKKGRAFKPSDFDPYDKQPGEVTEVTPETIGTLKEAFLQQQGRKGF
jgi:hypothetical protein